MEGQKNLKEDVFKGGFFHFFRITLVLMFKSEFSKKPSVWTKLFSNKLAVLGLLIIVFLTLIAVLGANIRPDQTPFANDQHLEIARQKPGFKVRFLKVRKDQIIKSKGFIDKLFFGGEEGLFEWFPIRDYSINDEFIEIKTYDENQAQSKIVQWSYPEVLFALDPAKNIVEKDGIFTIPLIDNQVIEVTLSDMKAMATDHLVYKTFALGTDKFGRDLLSRLMAGTLVSLSVGFIAVLISLVIGITLGALAGYFRGWIDEVIMWVINVVWSIPTILLVIAITLALGKGFYQVFIAVGLTMWVEVARVVRGQVLSLREKEFIEAGKVLGFSHFRIIFFHVLPNVMGPVIVISAANFATAILIEAGLSFLGIGTQIPMASWGGIIKNHYYYMTTDLAFLAISPGVCIMVLVLALMLIGNGLRDAFDVRSVSI